MNTGLKSRRGIEKTESKRIGTFAVIYSVILILASAVFQTTLFSRFAINRTVFDSTILTAIFLAIYTNEYYGSVFGLVLGTVSDMIYPSPFPVMPVVYLVLCAFCGVHFKEMKKKFFIQKIGVAIICVAIRSGILALLRMFTFDEPIKYFISAELPHFAYTACLVPVFMLICSPAGRASGGRRSRDMRL